MRVRAIDPGEWSGVAVFDDGLLVFAGLAGKGRDEIVDALSTEYFEILDGIVPI